MDTRFTAVFDDGSDQPVTFGSFDTIEEAEEVGEAAATNELMFVAAVRRVDHAGLTHLARRLRLSVLKTPDCSRSSR
jgi:hypothetical protein